MDLERSMGGSCDASGEASTPGPEKSYDSGNRAQSQRSAERIGDSERTWRRRAEVLTTWPSFGKNV